MPFAEQSRYTRIAIVLHWVMAILIVAAFALGWYMSDLKFSPRTLKLFSYHKWIGITVLGLAAARLLWRLFHRPPALPSHMPGWQRFGAHAVHWLLYLLFFLTPLAGWVYSSAAGFPVVYLGLWQLPDLVQPDKALAQVMEQRHAFLAYTLAVVVVLHVLAALKHAFEEPRGYLRRMTSFSS